MAKHDNNGGWTKTVVAKNGQIYEAVNTDAFKEMGYPVPKMGDAPNNNPSDTRPLHTHYNPENGFYRDFWGNKYDSKGNKVD